MRLLLPALLAAWLPNAATAQTSARPLAKGNYTLTVFLDQGWVQPAEEQLAKQFQQQTGITVKYDPIPDSTYQTLLTTKLNSGQMPGDIYMGQPTQAGLQLTYEVEQHAVDLSNQPWVSREDALIRAQSSIGGKLYGQTIWDTVGGDWVMDYNKNDFATAGITGVPTTYAELVADCAKLKAAGINPIYEPLSDGWHQTLWFFEAGPQMQKLDPGLAQRLNRNQQDFAGTPVALGAMTQIEELYKDGYFGPTPETDTVANAPAALASGKYAMFVWSVAYPSVINAAYPKVPVSQFGFFPMPILDNQLIPANPQAPTKFVYKGGPHVAGAEEYLDFLAETQNLNYMIKHTSTFLSLDFTGVKSNFSPAQAAFFKQYKLSSIATYQVSVNYTTPQWGNVATDITAMFTGQETPLQVLQNIDMRRAQEAQEAHDPLWPSS
ncbi:MAG: ABC transporter substrate-binding protein [Acidimicrobiales bacterium]